MQILSERIFPSIPNYVYNKILSISSPNNKPNAITKWICTQYENNRFKSLDDGITTNLEDLIFSYNKYKHKLKPIMDYKTVEELEDAINDVNLSGYKSKADFDKVARRGATKIYNDSNYMILKINNWEASKKYGSRTRWCISTRNDPELFKHYLDESNGNIHFIVDKINKEYKYACVGNVCYDEYDDILFVLSDDGVYYEQVGDSGELGTRLKESKNLINILPLGFPQFDSEYVKEMIIKTAKGEFIPQD